jgi:hypothetical protein
MTDSWTSTSTATRTSTPPATSTETPSSTSYAFFHSDPVDDGHPASNRHLRGDAHPDPHGDVHPGRQRDRLPESDGEWDEHFDTHVHLVAHLQHHGHLDAHNHVDRHGDGDRDTHSDGDLLADLDFHGNLDGHRNVDPDGLPHRDVVFHAFGYVFLHIHVDRDRHPNPDRHSDLDSDLERHIHPDLECDVHSELHGDLDVHHDGDVDLDYDAHLHPCRGLRSDRRFGALSQPSEGGEGGSLQPGRLLPDERALDGGDQRIPKGAGGEPLDPGDDHDRDLGLEGYEGTSRSARVVLLSGEARGSGPSHPSVVGDALKNQGEPKLGLSNT